MFNKLTLTQRLITSFLVVGLLPIVIMALLFINNASSTIEAVTFKKLTAVREMKAAQIENYFGTIRKQMLTASSSVQMADAMKAFSKTFKTFRDGNKLNDLESMRSSLKAYYSNQFGQEFAAQNSGQVDLSQLERIVDRLDDDSIALQYHYISANTNPLGSKHLLDSPNDSSEYSKVHAHFHPTIRRFLEEFGYYDIFLVDIDTGDIVYSVFKELDFSTSLLDGPYADTNFAEAFKAAKNSNSPDFVKLVDFKPYYPSYMSPASFIASPIFSEGEKVGVLIFQMPIEQINSIMTSDSRWKEVGLGESGETYLVGKDLSMRSQSRFLMEAPEDYFSLMSSIGMETRIVEAIKAKNTTILLQSVNTPGTEAAVRGETSVEVFDDYRGVAVVSAYRPLEIKDMQWAIMAELDEAEAFASLNSLVQQTLVCLGIGIVGILLIAWFVSRSISRPLRDIMLKLDSSSDQVSASSDQVSASSDSLAQGATEQASSLEETAASLEEVASMAKQNADNAQLADNFTDSVRGLSDQGVASMEEMSSAIDSIQVAADETSEIIKIIDDIAFQTNLLALNAAVEAARAGGRRKGLLQWLLKR